MRRRRRLAPLVKTDGDRKVLLLTDCQVATVFLNGVWQPQLQFAHQTMRFDELPEDYIHSDMVANDMPVMFTSACLSKKAQLDMVHSQAPPWRIDPSYNWRRTKC